MKDPPKLRAELQRIKHAVKQNFRRTRKSQAASVRASRILAESSASGSNEATEPAHEGSEFREAELIMYYLDYIFPLQYAYYEDKPAQGGRGWLFWLLSKKGPLRHAAFTLSALHQHTISQSKTEEMESELIRHHTNAMQELRQVLGRCEMEGFDSHPEYRVEFLTCGTFLISFEVTA
ncbi:Trichothecene biosynthesis transcription regulator TRI10 [Colletotrichum shisoi]|uniref:Trichothecene biosynthesis transcription regulator TRI10 n=1 Tax=Colletotrichum shisoi TaxID=2078593 RepID=A0A5Q4BMC6_9PEZI|nr:Trichothecene biosynthesis transcription regulator TRI10 [Colletotrichum shisoi]